MNIAPTLHSCNKSHLIVVYDLFDALLYLVCLHFVEDFSVYVYQKYWPIVFIFCIARHILMKLYNTKDKNKIFKATKKTSEIVIEATIRWTANFLSATTNAII